MIYSQTTVLSAEEMIGAFDRWVKDAKDKETFVYADHVTLCGLRDPYLTHVRGHYEAQRVELFLRRQSSGTHELIAVRTRRKTRKVFDAIQKHMRSNPHEK